MIPANTRRTLIQCCFTGVAMNYLDVGLRTKYRHVYICHNVYIFLFLVVSGST